MSISALDLFKIGIGPSSSHTMGPMRAGALFAAALEDRIDDVVRLQIDLYGSLAATGIGHGTDKAVVGGLMGHRPESVDPDEYAAAVDAVGREGRIVLDGRRPIPFDWATDLRFHRTPLPRHPNALDLTALDADGAVVATNRYYSIGGGFVVDETQAEAGSTGVREVAVRHPFDTAHELLEIAAREGLSIAQVVAANELAWRPAQATRSALIEIWQVMEACVDRGIRQEGYLPGVLHVPRRAPALHRQLTTDTHPNLITITFSAMEWVNLYALAVNEENAGGGRVVTAPTNGAAGVIPAVLHYYMDFAEDPGDDDVVDFLLAATAVGVLLKQNASISGAEVGCQGEVGSACAMAAAGLAQVLGGTPGQVENAAEIGLEHNLGLTCDPIGGLVQVPCIERNAMAAVKAINAAQLALCGDGTHRVTLDQAIRTMRDTGRDMLSKYKETSTGGLAVAFIEC
ncbi:L-serine dehydratase [Tessaracoccus bendigoensis DSM 12906]|uniref:L-serine dehydratase n=1 Tax=Tessaracoccus bendigoensis DSM 12906 TaxID=1123357 RepID=A0A1M6GMU7_9ACTN|nr:L-serine ammonia-lyase [Tessaracoccus bendigoensis]SHJ11223.1 L-serine dehydratase [Tessaracoccus bendigoensis DSM 12906]